MHFTPEKLQYNDISIQKNGKKSRYKKFSEIISHIVTFLVTYCNFFFIPFFLHYYCEKVTIYQFRFQNVTMKVNIK